MTSTTVEIASNVQLGRALLDGFNMRDLSAWESALADDVEISYPGFRGMRGKDAARTRPGPSTLPSSRLSPTSTFRRIARSRMATP